jgi:hypothetical protein
MKRRAFSFERLGESGTGSINPLPAFIYQCWSIRSQVSLNPPFNCTRSDALDFQFPPPRYDPTLSTGSPKSKWRRSWSLEGVAVLVRRYRITVLDQCTMSRQIVVYWPSNYISRSDL